MNNNKKKVTTCQCLLKSTKIKNIYSKLEYLVITMSGIYSTKILWKVCMNGEIKYGEIKA